MYRCGYYGELDKAKVYYDCEGDLEICNFDKRTIGHLAASEKHYGKSNQLLIKVYLILT